MRNGQNNKRMRNRNNGGGGGSNNNNNNNNNRRGQNPLTRVFESNGPDIKIRGTASHLAEKYVQLARDARSSGDPVASENYYQHAEHYFRLIATAQEQFRQNQPQPRNIDDVPSPDDLEDDGESFSNFGQEPGFVPVQQQPQPFMRDRDGGPRENQPYQRDQQQPREHREPRQQREPREPREHREPREQREPREPREQREHREPREHIERPQPQFQPQPQPQPVIAVDSGVDRLPSFITGPQPQVANAPAAFVEGGAERYPRRRRRPQGPRPDAAAATAPVPSEDVNTGE